MTEVQEREPATEENSPVEVNTGRERSKIRFPYGDLDSAVEVALAVSKYGLDCETAQLAGQLNVTAGSPSYRARLANAQTFGLAQVDKTTIRLTPIGRRLLDPGQTLAAKADAFLSVPLYREIYDRFDGTVLPETDPALEAEMVKAGVAAKVAHKARQAFHRSAEQAGFYAAGRNRLIRPSTGTFKVPEEGRLAAPPLPADDREEDVMSNALLAALFKKMLPAEGQEFSAGDRRRLFRALAVNLDVIYGEPNDGEIDPEQLAAIMRDKPKASMSSRVDG